jgi:hypothetical protein
MTMYQSKHDRRQRRSLDTTQALALQLRACCEDARLDAMVLADEDGLCLAAAGPETTCQEVAATLPVLGRKAGDFTGVLLAAGRALETMVHRFRCDESSLYLCAIGGDESLRARQIARSIGGVTRILTHAD